MMASNDLADVFQEGGDDTDVAMSEWERIRQSRVKVF